MSFKLLVTQDASAMGTLTEGVAASSTNTYRSLKALLDGDAASLGLEFETTGTLTGTWTLWYSNEMFPDETTDTDWTQDTSFVPTNPAGAASRFFSSLGNVNARWVRVKYVNASGTGNILCRAAVPRLR
jgi:hypothetical protein